MVSKVACGFAPYSWARSRVAVPPGTLADSTTGPVHWLTWGR